MLLHALAAGLAELPSLIRIGKQVGDALGQRLRKGVGLGREAGDRILIEGNQPAGFAIHNNFKNSASGAGNHWRGASHRFKVDDAEWLIDRWAAEDRAIRIELDGLFFRDHLFNPDDARVKAANLVDFPAQLRGNFRCVRRARAQHHLRFARQVANGVNQVGYALLPGDAADEEHVGNGGIDAVGAQRRCVSRLACTGPDRCRCR